MWSWRHGLPCDHGLQRLQGLNGVLRLVSASRKPPDSPGRSLVDHRVKVLLRGSCSHVMLWPEISMAQDEVRLPAKATSH